MFDAPAVDEATKRFFLALGHRIKQAHPLFFNRGGVKIHGSLAPLEMVKNDARMLWFVVNGRYVRDRMLQKAVCEGLEGRVPQGSYPMGVIYIDIDPAIIDVNVHPQKSEVRFADSALMFASLKGAVAKSFLQIDAPPVTKPVHATCRPPLYRLAARSHIADDAPAACPPALGTDPPPHFLSGYEIVGELFASYLLCKSEQHALLIDLPRAYQVYLYETLLQEFTTHQQIAPHLLMFPVAKDVDAVQAQRLAGQCDTLRCYGVDIEQLLPSRFILKTLPQVLIAADVPDIFTALCELAKIQTPDDILKIFTKNTPLLPTTDRTPLFAFLRAYNFSQPRGDTQHFYTTLDAAQLKALFG